MVNPVVREVAAGGAASLFLLALLNLSSLGFAVSAALAGAVYLGVRMLVPTTKAKAAPNLEQEQARRIEKVARQAGRFAELSSQMRSRDPQVAQDLSRVSRAVGDLARELSQDPDHLLAVGELLEMHLPSSLSLVERHVALAERPHLDDSGRRELEQSRLTVGKIAGIFEAQLARLAEDDVRELKVDRLVFEEILRLEDPMPHNLEDHREFSRSQRAGKE